jgi:hypothetical protein
VLKVKPYIFSNHTLLENKRIHNGEKSWKIFIKLVDF